jgi:hypothetical protein
MENVNIRIFTYPFAGDLYKIFFDNLGKLYSIRCHALMSTAFSELNWADLPHDVQQAFENYFCK